MKFYFSQFTATFKRVSVLLKMWQGKAYREYNLSHIIKLLIWWLSAMEGFSCLI